MVRFFFSSRRRHTRFDCDWSSDVCSSDLPRREQIAKDLHGEVVCALFEEGNKHNFITDVEIRVAGCETGLLTSHNIPDRWRSEERRVGKECRSRWTPYDQKKKEEWPGTQM